MPCSALGGDNGAEGMNRFLLALTVHWGVHFPSALGNVWYKVDTTSPRPMKSDKLEDVAKSQGCPLTFPDGCSVGTLNMGTLKGSSRRALMSFEV